MGHQIASPSDVLATRLATRRRAGLADPDWSLTARERRQRVVALEEISRMLDNPQLPPKVPEDARPLGQVIREWTTAADSSRTTTEMLGEARRQIARQLYGDPPCAWWTEVSLVDPSSAPTSPVRFLLVVAPVLLFAVLVALGDSVVYHRILAGLLMGALVMIGFATVKTSRTSLRLREDDFRLTGPEASVVAIDSDTEVGAIAARIDRAAQLRLESPSWRAAHDTSDAEALLAERDQRMCELHGLVERLERLESIADAVPEANRGDHQRLVKEVAFEIVRLDETAELVSSETERYVEQDRRAALTSKRAAATAELDRLASPPSVGLRRPPPA